MNEKCNVIKFRIDNNPIGDVGMRKLALGLRIHPKIEKILVTRGEMEILEKRREASRINIDGDRNNPNQGNFMSNFNFNFNFGNADKDKNIKRDNVAIAHDELRKLEELKVNLFKLNI